jgi:outer membrane protein OmpU
MLIINNNNKQRKNMNLKKIGLTALAGSLVATSVFAGEMAVTGSASMKVEHVNGGAANAGKSFSMGNQLEFAGSGELDNGLKVSLSFVLDQNDDSTAAGLAKSANSGTPFDSHSVSISSDALGTLTFHGEGGSSAQSAMDTTAAGDLWDNGYGVTLAHDTKTSATSDNMIFYTLPSLVDALTVTASYTPKGANADSSTAFGLSYAGVEGLSLNYAVGEDNATAAATADVTTMKASYAYGPISIGYSETEYDGEATGTTVDQEVKSYNVSYTVSENISIAYGTEEFSQPNLSTSQDIKVDAITASYTTGGMTISGMMGNADNTAHSTAVLEDKSMWHLVASFAF